MQGVTWPVTQFQNLVDGKNKKNDFANTFLLLSQKLKRVDRQLKKSCLKPGVSFEQLDRIAYQYSDNEFADMMRQQERKLFATIQKITITKFCSRREKKG